ncbi:hypothetical protein B0H11DRAFT_2183294, partial [Mycena galericulata]
QNTNQLPRTASSYVAACSRTTNSTADSAINPCRVPPSAPFLARVHFLILFFAFSFFDFLCRSFTVCAGHPIVSSTSSFVPLTEPSTPLASNDSLPPLHCLFSFVATTSPLPPPAPPPSHSFVLPPPLPLPSPRPLSPPAVVPCAPTYTNSFPTGNGNETVPSCGILRYGRIEVHEDTVEGLGAFFFVHIHRSHTSLPHSGRVTRYGFLSPSPYTPHCPLLPLLVFRPLCSYLLPSSSTLLPFLPARSVFRLPPLLPLPLPLFPPLLSSHLSPSPSLTLLPPLRTSSSLASHPHPLTHSPPSSGLPSECSPSPTPTAPGSQAARLTSLSRAGTARRWRHTLRRLRERCARRHGGLLLLHHPRRRRRSRQHRWSAPCAQTQP